MPVGDKAGTEKIELSANGSKSEPVAKGDEPRTPPNAMIGVSGMIAGFEAGDHSPDPARVGPQA